jgi:hypothetical protein
MLLLIALERQLYSELLCLQDFLYLQPFSFWLLIRLPKDSFTYISELKYALKCHSSFPLAFASWFPILVQICADSSASRDSRKKLNFYDIVQLKLQILAYVASQYARKDNIHVGVSWICTRLNCSFGCSYLPFLHVATACSRHDASFFLSGSSISSLKCFSLKLYFLPLIGYFQFCLSFLGLQTAAPWMTHMLWLLILINKRWSHMTCSRP